MLSLMLRRRAMIGKKDLPVMNPALGYTAGYVLDHTLPFPYLSDTAPNASLLAVSDYFYVGSTGALVMFKPLSKSINASVSMGNVLGYASTTSAYNEWWNVPNKPDGTVATYGIHPQRQYFRITFDPDTMADMYAYNSSTGEVYYAGINTPYYGKTNIYD